MGRSSRSGIRSVVERHSGYLVLLHLPNGDHPEAALDGIPHRHPQDLTDQGSEMVSTPQIGGAPITRIKNLPACLHLASDKPRRERISQRLDASVRSPAVHALRARRRPLS
jgi:hypothetical protein